MNCYICQDLCYEKNIKCKCDGYIAYIHDKCLYEMIEKTNNNVCYFCDTEYDIPKSMKVKIRISRFYNNYIISNKIKILIIISLILISLIFNIDINITKEVYYEVLADTEII